MIKIPKIPTRYMKLFGSFKFYVGSIFGVGSFIWAFVLTSEYVILDNRMAVRNAIFQRSEQMQARYATKDVVVVYVPPGTLMEMRNKAGSGPDGVTPRGYLASLVSAVSRGKPHVIGLDYILEEPDSDKNDRALLAAIRGARSRGVRVVGGYRIVPVIEERSGEGDTIKTDFVKTDITRRYDAAFTSAGFLNLVAEDIRVGDTSESMVRYSIPDVRGSDSFARRVYAEYLAALKGKNGRVPPDCADPDMPGPLFINYRYEKPEYGVSVKRSDYVVREGTEMPEPVLTAWFAGKIVLIANADIVNDVHRIPADAGAGTYGVLVHAAVLNNYLKNDFIRKSPMWISILLGVLFFISAFMIASRFPVGRVLMLLSGLILAFLAGAYAVFITGSVWMPVVPLFIVFFVTTMAVVVYRVVYTEKDRVEADDFLKNAVPETLMERLLVKNTSIFDTKRDQAYIIVGWTRNLSLGDRDDPRAVIRFLEWYSGLVRHAIFENEGCFNWLPSNGFVGFWPRSFYGEEIPARVIDAAESIQAIVPAIRQKAVRLFGSRVDLQVDVAILEDEAFIGSFDGRDKKSYTLRSDMLTNLLANLSVFGNEAKSNVYFFNDFAPGMAEIGKTEKLKIKLAGRPVYRVK